MRLVIDTNVLVSGVIGQGPPRQLVDGIMAGTFEFATSDALLAELLEVLSRRKFANRLEQAGLTARGIVSDLARLALIVAADERPTRGAD